MSAPFGYEAIKALASETGRSIGDLIVLARNNDPFFCGTPAHVRDAEWFAAWWKKLNYVGRLGIHLRAVHYRLVSQATPPVMPSGVPYLNTEGCWGYLSAASKLARYLGLVDAESFIDRRNPDPQIYDWGGFEPGEPRLILEDWKDWHLPEIFLYSGNLDLPRFSAPIYRYNPGQQPYHLEIWIEKSTMDNVLLPVCIHHRINLVTSIGFQSVPSTIALLWRAYSTQICHPFQRKVATHSSARVTTDRSAATQAVYC